MAVIDQRSRILDAALGLMAEQGARGMSMRSLAAACDLNVATLYHYFPSKHELFRAALEHRRYEALLENPFPEGLAGDPVARLTAVLDHVFSEIAQTNDLWRVLITEYLHGDPAVAVPLLEMSDAFESALGRWLADLFPDVERLRDPLMVRALRLSIYGVLVEHLPAPTELRNEVFAARARELAHAFAGVPNPSIPEPPTPEGP
jgi:AcrR family transcriptional regulator